VGVGREIKNKRVIEGVSDIVGSLPYCHSEIRDGKTIYQASSPDEAALCAGAELLGYEFQVRSNGTRTYTAS